MHSILAFSTESGLKYFVTGSFISGLFLFGCSLLYGILGTLNFQHLSLLLSIPFEESYSSLYYLLLIGVLLITITFLFKISAAPFHFWSPDVYEGAPLATTVVFSIVPKFAIFSFFIKWLCIINTIFSQVQYLLLISGILSVFVGTFFAIRQKRVKRLVIYSSIAQVGFLVAALSVISVNSLVAVYFFLTIYIITSVLVWSNISIFYSFQNKINVFYNKAQTPLFISSLSNLFKINSLWALSFIIIFFSIAGMPPLSGFFAKILILFSLIATKNLIGSIFLILISAVSVFYYLRVIKIIFFGILGYYTIKNTSCEVFF